MSPEQGHGQPLDERSDLYSLGVIFYEMLMRQKPYIAQSPMAVIYMHANAPIPLLPEALRKLSAAAATACWRRTRSIVSLRRARCWTKIEELR